MSKFVKLLRFAGILAGVVLAGVLLGWLGSGGLGSQTGAPEGVFQNLGVKSSAIAGIIADDRVVAVTLTGS